MKKLVYLMALMLAVTTVGSAAFAADISTGMDGSSDSPTFSLTVPSVGYWHIEGSGSLGAITENELKTDTIAEHSMVIADPALSYFRTNNEGRSSKQYQIKLVDDSGSNGSVAFNTAGNIVLSRTDGTNEIFNAVIDVTQADFSGNPRIDGVAFDYADAATLQTALGASVNFNRMDNSAAAVSVGLKLDGSTLGMNDLVQTGGTDFKGTLIFTAVNY